MASRKHTSDAEAAHDCVTCLGCLGWPLIIHQTIKNLDRPIHNWIVKCITCGTPASEGSTRQEAVADWNRRNERYRI